MKKNLLVFDTNVLLDLYSYTDSTIESLIEGFEGLKTYDIFIPRRVCFEFNKNSNKADRQNPVAEGLTDIRRKKAQFIAYCDNLKSNNVISKRLDKTYNDLIDNLKKTVTAYDDIENKLEELKSKKIYEESLKKSNVIADFVKKNELPYFNINELVYFATKFDKRKELNIPTPGEMDNNKKLKEKDPFDAYGDFIIWEELVSKASGYLNVILLENETKKDWWSDYKNRKPKIGLIEEFENINPGIKLEFYSLIDFVENEFDSFDTSAVTEVKDKTIQFNEYINGNKFENNIRFYLSNSLYDFDFYSELIGAEFDCGTIDDFELSEITILTISNYDVEVNNFYELNVFFDFQVKADGVVSKQLYEDITIDFSVSIDFDMRCQMVLTLNYDEEISCVVEEYYEPDCVDWNIVESINFVELNYPEVD